MPSDQILATHRESPRLHAGFWLRVFAYLIDGFLRVGVFWILTAIVGNLVGEPVWRFDDEYLDTPYETLFVLIIVAMFVFYHPLFEASRWQATPGKRLMGIKVVDVYGNRLSLLRAFGRHAAGALSYLTTFVFSFGYWMAGITERKQALHDIVARCLVIRDPKAFVQLKEPEPVGSATKAVPD